MEFKIRECRVEDFEAIYSLNKKELGYDYPMENTRDKLVQLIGDSTNKIYVATLLDVVIGYVHATDYDVLYAPHMKNIMGIVVTQEFKNYGIGRALLEKVEDWAKNTNATEVLTEDTI